MLGGETSGIPEQVSLCPDKRLFWCDKFGCKEEMLKSAVNRVGQSPFSVEQEIQRVNARAKEIEDLADAMQAKSVSDEDVCRIGALIDKAKAEDGDYSAIKHAVHRLECVVHMLGRTREGQAQGGSAQGRWHGGR